MIQDAGSQTDSSAKRDIGRNAGTQEMPQMPPRSMNSNCSKAPTRETWPLAACVGAGGTQAWERMNNVMVLEEDTGNNIQSGSPDCLESSSLCFLVVVAVASIKEMTF